MGALRFIGVELVAHAALALRGHPNFSDGPAIICDELLPVGAHAAKDMHERQQGAERQRVQQHALLLPPATLLEAVLQLVQQLDALLMTAGDGG